jgi:hypothetical protein
MEKVLIPKYLKATAPDLLRELMLENTLLLKADVKYFDIQFVSGYWFVWFYEEIDLMGLLRKSNERKKPK